MSNETPPSWYERLFEFFHELALTVSELAGSVKLLEKRVSDLESIDTKSSDRKHNLVGLVISSAISSVVGWALGHFIK